MLAKIDGGRARDAACIMFAAWIAFVVAGLHFYGMVDDTPYAHIIDEHTALGWAWRIVEYGSVLALLAVLVGGLPIAWQIWRNAPAQRRFFWVPVIAFLVIAAPIVFVLVKVLTNQIHPVAGATPNYVPLIVYGILFLAAAIASTWAVIVAVRRAPIADRFYQFALVPALVTALLMAVMTGGAIAWSIIASGKGVAGFSDLNPLTTSPALGSLIFTCTWMALATLVGIIGLARGVRQQAS